MAVAGGVVSGAVIRAAVAADLPACAEIVNDWLDEAGWLPRPKCRDEIAAMFEPALLTRRRMLVAEDAGQVVGYLTMAEDGDVPALYLAPPARGWGLGRRMLDRAKAMSADGITLRVWEPNTAARRFYAREGFIELPKRRDDAPEEGVPTLWLRWPGAEGAT